MVIGNRVNEKWLGCWLCGRREGGGEMEEGLLEENLKLGEKRDLAGQGESEQQQKQDKVEWRVMKANGLNQGKNTEVRGGEESVPTGNTGLSVTSEPLFLFFFSFNLSFIASDTVWSYNINTRLYNTNHFCIWSLGINVRQSSNLFSYGQTVMFKTGLVSHFNLVKLKMCFTAKDEA